MQVSKWEKTNNRFVAFFDILGFKDLVARFKHEEIVEKLESLLLVIDKLSDANSISSMQNYNIDKDQTKSIIFSDSIIFFSKGSTFNDALKISYDAFQVCKNALNAGIAIKGCISYGQVTVDFSKSLFFGQAIIDAFLLHEELQMLTVLLDNKAENQIDTYEKKHIINSILSTYKANLKTGKINHTLLKPYNKKQKDERVLALQKLYATVSGKPRLYIDNTLDYINSLNYVE